MTVLPLTVYCVSIDIPRFWEGFFGAAMDFSSVEVSYLKV